MTPNHSNFLMNQALSVYAPPRAAKAAPTIAALLQVRIHANAESDK